MDRGVVQYDAIILAGGRGSRLGGIDKAQLLLDGSPLVERPLGAAGGAQRTVVVGPDSLARDGVLLTREHPPGGGPAAGTAAGIQRLADGDLAPWVLLLSCDLPLAAAGVAHLLAAATPEISDIDGYCLTDVDGRLQWLFALYHSDALLRAVRDCPQPAGTSMRTLLAELNLVGVPDTGEVSADLDTWEDHAAWTERLEEA